MSLTRAEVRPAYALASYHICWLFNVFGVRDPYRRLGSTRQRISGSDSPIIKTPTAMKRPMNDSVTISIDQSPTQQIRPYSFTIIESRSAALLDLMIPANVPIKVAPMIKLPSRLRSVVTSECEFMLGFVPLLYTPHGFFVANCLARASNSLRSSARSSRYCVFVPRISTRRRS